MILPLLGLLIFDGLNWTLRLPQVPFLICSSGNWKFIDFSSQKKKNSCWIGYNFTESYSQTELESWTFWAWSLFPGLCSVLSLTRNPIDTLRARSDSFLVPPAWCRTTFKVPNRHHTIIKVPNRHHTIINVPNRHLTIVKVPRKDHTCILVPNIHHTTTAVPKWGNVPLLWFQSLNRHHTVI